MSVPAKIRVLVVDDHPFFRTGIVQWINQQAELTCCGQAESVAQARKATLELKPDIVLLDLHLPDGDGLDLCQELTQDDPALRILCLTHRDENTFAHRALRAGARGYVMKSEATDTVLAGILTVMKGEIAVSRMVAARALHNLFPDPVSPSPDLARLSDRELQVFQLIGAGCGNKEVSETLKISPKTVETYRERLKEKLNLADATALARAAGHWVEHGKLPSP
jgi:DNA-binding NarL/FixJ family response regulator